MSFASLHQARAKREAGSSFARPTSDSNATRSSDNIAEKAVVNHEPTESTPQPSSPSDSTATRSSSSKGALYSQLPPFLEIKTTSTSGRGIWAKPVDGGGVQVIPADRESLPPTSHQALTLLSHSLARYITASDQPSAEALSKFGINSARDLLDLISKFTVNSFTLTNPSLTSIGVAVSPLAALINHSCEPNAVVVFPRSSVVHQSGSDPLEVVAIKDIAAGEEILTSYVDVSLPRHLRIKELQERYMFTCTCSACSRAEDGTVDPREAMKCERPGCRGLIPLPVPGTKSRKTLVCSTCKQALVTDVDDVLDAIRLGEEALERATSLELEDPASAYNYTSNMMPLLSRHVPTTTHPLLALCRLHLSLLISQLAEAIEILGRSLADESITSEAISGARLPKEQVDEVCAAAARSVAAVSAVFPEGHPVRGVALAELGKLLCVDVDQDAQAIEHIVSPGVAASDPSSLLASASETGVSPFPAGEERLKLARNVLLRARTELRRGFGGEGGEVARQVEESIRNLEKEWKGWKKLIEDNLRGEVKDLVNAALVCRAWSEWALEVRWKDFKVPVRAAIQVLAPVESVPYGMYNFQGKLNVVRVQWRRFVEISNKITSIVVDCKLVPTIHGDLLFAEKAFGGKPFANLRRLEILADLTSWTTASLFAVPSVKEVRLEATLSNARALMNMVDVYMPRSELSLESLDVCLPGQRDWLPDISRYPRLKQLTCHISQVRAKTWKTLGNGLNLNQLSIHEDQVPNQSSDQEWDGVSVKLPTLQKLAFAAETKAARNAILHSVMENLETLQFELTPQADRMHQSILAHLSASSPRLRLGGAYP
ncbi:hypothetical protein FRC05_005249 [Tulasnella sp. 425]|nr:hypothetical protein FRC05_005249 [Tulasnella sp. 425]